MKKSAIIIIGILLLSGIAVADHFKYATPTGSFTEITGAQTSKTYVAGLSEQADAIQKQADAVQKQMDAMLSDANQNIARSTFGGQFFDSNGNPIPADASPYPTGMYNEDGDPVSPLEGMSDEERAKFFKLLDELNEINSKVRDANKKIEDAVTFNPSGITYDGPIQYPTYDRPSDAASTPDDFWTESRGFYSGDKDDIVGGGGSDYMVAPTDYSFTDVISPGPVNPKVYLDSTGLSDVVGIPTQGGFDTSLPIYPEISGLALPSATFEDATNIISAPINTWVQILEGLVQGSEAIPPFALWGSEYADLPYINTPNGYDIPKYYQSRQYLQNLQPVAPLSSGAGGSNVGEAGSFALTTINNREEAVIESPTYVSPYSAPLTGGELFGGGVEEPSAGPGGLSTSGFGIGGKATPSGGVAYGSVLYWE